MKKCPFCGADIEESARFCLYCMQSLTEKEQIIPHRKKKPQYLMIIAAIVTPLLILAAIGFGGQIALGNETTSDTSSDTSSITESAHIPATAVKENYVDSSCAETGSYDEVVYCSGCNKELSRTTITIPQKSHTAETPVVENKVESTCKETGSYNEVIYCSTCGNELSRSAEIIPQKPHTEVVDKIVAPTCTDTGLTEGKHCSVCDTILVAQTTVDALGHTEVSDEAVAPDCVNTGLTEGKHCSVCDTILVAQQTIPATDHNYSNEWTVDDTHHWHTCLNSNCTSVSDKTDHSFGEWIVDTAATCIDAGTRHHICASCQTSASETYDSPDAHSYDDKWTVGETHHWHTCLYCNSITDKKSHLIDNSGKCSFCGHLTTPPTDGIIYMVSDDGTYAEVVDYVASNKNVIIATEYKGVPVTKIGNSAFAEKSIMSVYIPNSIIDIGPCAFQYCRSLKSVTIGNRVTSIGNNAFSCCAITELTIPDSVTSVGVGAFYTNSALTKVKIGNGLTAISMHMFKGCSSLISVTIPDSVERIEDGAFSGCDALTSVILGDNVAHIGNYAFELCSNLANITIPDSLTIVGIDAFYGCNNLTEKVGSITYIENIVISVDNTAIVELRKGTQVIAAEAFLGCIKLRKVTMPDSVIGISASAFLICENLESVTMSKNLKHIGDRAFANCKNLSSIVIPDSVACIDFQAFYNCSSLTSIKYCGTEADWNAISKSAGWDYGTSCTITYNYTVE